MKSTWKNMLRNQSGLTLIELLAVILILGIIGAIAVGAFSGGGEDARVSSHEANVSTMEGAAERYDLELGFSEEADQNYTVVSDSHELVTEAYLNEPVESPWADTNSEHADYEYIVTRDDRGVMYVYLADVSGDSVDSVVWENNVDELQGQDPSDVDGGLNFVTSVEDLNDSSDRLFDGE